MSYTDPENWASYGDLLADLKNDLQLDASTDLLPGSVMLAILTSNPHHVAWAFIDGRAATFAVLSGSGINAARTGAGRYTLTWRVPFVNAPAVLLTGAGVPGSESLFTPTVLSTVCTVAINALPANVAADDLFSVIAIG